MLLNINRPHCFSVLFAKSPAGCREKAARFLVIRTDVRIGCSVFAMRFNGGSQLYWSRIERILSGRQGPNPVRDYDDSPTIIVATPLRTTTQSQVPIVDLYAIYYFSHYAMAAVLAV